MTTVMLVQGAWHQPSTWAKLESQLHGLGYATHTVALPSGGVEPTGSMYDDAAVIRRELASLKGPVTVLAHSYGGVPVTEAAGGAGNVTHLIYLAAYMLGEGESMYSLYGAPEPDDTSGLYPYPDNPRVSLYGELPDEEAEEAVRQLVNQTQLSLADKVTSAAWQTIPATYIVCENDPGFPKELQEKLGEHAEVTRWLASGHFPFLTMPETLAVMIDDIIKG